MEKISIVVLIILSTVVFAPEAKAIQDPLKLNKVSKETPKKKHRPAKVVVAPIEYVVQEGDTLSKIGEVYKVPVNRLWLKNTNLSNPDLLNIGDKLVIPKPEEVLAERAPITPAVAPKITRPVIPGNAYAPGNCTFYAKSKRPDLPNYLGDANLWGINAAAQGWTVDSTPEVGAVGVAVGYMHVVYIEAVNGNMVTLSEMNYQGPYIVSTRTAPISEFVYIH